MSANRARRTQKAAVRRLFVWRMVISENRRALPQFIYIQFLTKRDVKQNGRQKTFANTALLW